MSGLMQSLRALARLKPTQKLTRDYLVSLLTAVLLALAVGAAIMLVCGHNPIEGYGALIEGALGKPRAIGNTLAKTVTLCLTGLAMSLAAKAGVFNVGGEGQLLLGGILACQVGVWLDGSPRALVIVCAALAAMAVGGLYALVPGVLKVKVKVNEVITTIMLNSIAAYLCSFLAKGPWKNANKNMVAATESLDARYWFGGLIRGSTLSTAIFAAAIIAFLVWYIMQKTARGFEMKLTGQNPRFARFAGLKTDRLIIACMTVSGMLCGLVGMFRVYGAEHIYRDSISRDYYFEGLMVAMIAQYRPLPVIGLSLLFAVLKIGADEMQAIGVPTQIYQIIQTVVIFFMAAETGISAMLRARAQKKRAHRAAEERMKGGVDRA